MIDGLNPYEELGIDRGATEDEIRWAYRKAAKLAHPDAGGTAEAFDKIATSLAVLTDPARRKTFDETGRIDGGQPDNDRAAALQVVERHVADLVNAFINTGMDPAKDIPDPRTLDVPAEIVRRIEGEIRMAEQGLEGGARIVAYLKDLGARFEPKADVGLPEGEEDPIARGFKRQVEQNERQLANLRKSIEVHRLAIEIARGYSFLAAPIFIDPAAYYRGDPSPYTWPVTAAGV